MEKIHTDIEYDKFVHSAPSTRWKGTSSSETTSHKSIIVILGLLSVFLLVGLISLGVHYSSSVRGAAAELSSVEAELTELLKANRNLSEERDLLKANLTEQIKKLHRPPSRNRTCPAGWMRLTCFCYLFSNESGSWTTARDDCRDRGADLVVIDSTEEQKFLYGFTKVDTWIGLNDRNEERTWEWVDGSPLTVKHWGWNQPNNGGGTLGEEDCGHIRIISDSVDWNDLSCEKSLKWICEKML